jgi:hypothetical protein
LVTLEYSDPSKVLCHFQAKVIKISPQIIWVGCHQVIYRLQRRTLYRFKTQGGTEIVFRLSPEEEEKASVHDYSLGGVAFLSGRPLPLKTDDQLKDLFLRIPEKGEWLIVAILLAIISGFEVLVRPGTFLYALEILQMDENNKNFFLAIFLRNQDRYFDG